MFTQSFKPSFSSLLFLLLLCSITFCKSQKSSSCIPSSCGNIHDISFPFRLKSDPKNCGYPHPSFELECQNNHTIMTMNSRRFYVQSITYDNFLIRLVDPGLSNINNSCISLPSNFTGYDEIPSIFTDFLLNTPVMYTTCESSVNDSRYIETSFCEKSSNSSRVYSYVAVGDGTKLSDLQETCSVEMVAWGSSSSGLLNDSVSLSSIKEGLAYGFELSWYRVMCRDCDPKQGFCSLEGNTVTCTSVCYESTPVSEQSFRCQVEYYTIFALAYGIVSVGALSGLKFLIGFPLLVALIVYKWRKRHSTTDDYTGFVVHTGETS